MHKVPYRLVANYWDLVVNAQPSGGEASELNALINDIGFLMTRHWTHAELCDVAVNWLKRPYSIGGIGCHIAYSEITSGFNCEVPDAIGWRSCQMNDGAVVVEVKVSRSDFLRDKNKPHRNGNTIGLGSWRFYLCPEGLIKPGDLPENFGLLYVTDDGGIKSIVGPTSTRHEKERQRLLDKMRFSSDLERERYILVKLLKRGNKQPKQVCMTNEQQGKGVEDKIAVKQRKILAKIRYM